MPTSRFDQFIKSLLLLLGLSTVSALIIFFIPNLVTIIISNCNELACLVPLFVGFGLQWILIIPATILVVYFYKKQLGHDSLHVIHPVIYVLIPLLVNILAANPMLLPIFLEIIWDVIWGAFFNLR